MWDLTIHPHTVPSALAGNHALLQSMWGPQSTPFRGLASLLAHRLMSTPLRGSTCSLAHHLVSGSHTICNGPSPPLADIVSLWAFSFGLPLKVFKTHLIGRSFHTLIKNASFSSSTDVGSHKDGREKTKNWQGVGSFEVHRTQSTRTILKSNR